jgi:hypothetical protein
MTRKRHSDPIWNSCAHHIAHGGPTEIVHQNWIEANRLSGARPRLSKISNRLSVPMEHKWAIEPALGVRTLHYFKKLAREWQDPAILVLADFRPQVNDLAGKIHVAPFQRFHFAEAPSGEVQKSYGVPQVFRQILAQRDKRTMVDESLPRVVFLESRDVGHRAHPAILNSQGEHPL